jgi:hypothetical protein
MESAGFTELKNEVNRVRNCVIQYDELVELVKSAQRTLGQEWKGFSREKKEDVDDLLEQAEQNKRSCNRWQNIQIAVVRIQIDGLQPDVG